MRATRILQVLPVRFFHAQILQYAVARKTLFNALSLSRFISFAAFYKSMKLENLWNQTGEKDTSRNVMCKLMFIFLLSKMYVSHRKSVRTSIVWLVGWFILFLLYFRPIFSTLAKCLFLSKCLASKSRRQGIARLRQRKIDLSSLFQIWA